MNLPLDYGSFIPLSSEAQEKTVFTLQSLSKKNKWLRIVNFNNMNLYLLIFSFLFFIVGKPVVVWAQELPEPAPIEEASDPSSMADKAPLNEVAPEDFLQDNSLPFTGTLAEDDEENTQMQQEQALFGEDNEDSDQRPTISKETGNETHWLRFDLTGSVQFMPQEKGLDGELQSGAPYLEVLYTINFETAVIVNSRKNTINLNTQIDIDHWGVLARNEFFECRLDVDMPSMPVEISTKLNKKGGNQETEEETINDLAVKIRFSSDVKEDWFSLCNDFSGAILNSQGDVENYHAQILKMVEPSLNSLVIANFDFEEGARIDLSTPFKLIDDQDINNHISLSGNGSLTLDPI